MRIAVVSDSHGDMRWVNKIRGTLDSVDCVIHLGDYVGDARKLSDMLKCLVYYVAGNGDIMSSAPQVLEQSIGGVKIMAVHGHRHRVNDDLYSLAADAQSRDAKICLYGHTHIPDITNYYGIWFINPGSVSRARGMSKESYAIININKNGEVIPDIMCID